MHDKNQGLQLIKRPRSTRRSWWRALNWQVKWNFHSMLHSMLRRLLPFCPMLMPVPKCLRSLGDFSNTCAWIPRFRKPTAKAKPPIPPPTIATSISSNVAISDQSWSRYELCDQMSVLQTFVRNHLVSWGYWLKLVNEGDGDHVGIHMLWSAIVQ